MSFGLSSTSFAVFSFILFNLDVFSSYVWGKNVHVYGRNLFYTVLKYFGNFMKLFVCHKY